MDRFNKDIVDIALSVEEQDTVELHSTMLRRMPARQVSERYKHGNYSTNAPAIVLGNWSYRKPYIMCGLPGFGGAPSCCHQTFVCELCCKKAAARMYVRYQNSFSKARHWYAITYSFTSNVFLETATQAEYLERYAQADRFIKSLRASDLIQGAVAVKEVSVNSFHGKAVFPHTHVVVNSDRPDLVDMDGVLHPVIAEEASRTGVSLRIARITDPEIFLYELKYPLKPINIRKLYQEEQINYDTNEINVGLDIILGRLTQYTKGKPRIVYYGNMDARSKTYMGTRMNAKRNEERRIKAAATKQLNSESSSNTMVSELPTSPMPLPQPVLPPQQPPQKKRSLWGPLALGVGAGVAGLGAADYLLNKGRATSSILDSIKSRFGASGAPVTPPTVSKPSLPLPRNEGDVMADAAAGTIGSSANDNARDAWSKWMDTQRRVGYENTFRGATPPSTVSHPLLMNSEEGRLDHGIRNLGEYQGVNPTLKKILDYASTGVEDVATNSGKADVGLSLAAGGMGTLPSIPRIGGFFKDSPTFNKILGATRSLDSVNNKFLLGRFLGGAGGAVSGASLGANPLTGEAINDLLPGLTPQQASNLGTGVYGALGAAGGARVPLLGNAVLGINNAVASNAAETLRDMNASVAERGALADVLGRLYHGTRSGSPLHRNALERALQYIDSDPALQKSIAGEAAAPKWKLWKYFSPSSLGAEGWGGDLGSPALQSLINKSRQAIIN